MKQDQLDRREEEELEKAIQLSLKESQQQQQQPSLKNSNSSNSVKAANSSSSLFGGLMQTTQSISDNYKGTNAGATSNSAAAATTRRRVKALYDFEAAEDNEITFKAGDILFLSDDADPNWWKGFDMNGVEGLFPSNFVTFDLNEKIEVFDNKGGSSMSKKVSFNENVDVNLIQNSEAQQRKKIGIDEKKIDECIEMLQNADPTGEIQPDSQELLDLEEECYMMGPLIDKKLQEIDEQHAVLEDLNLKMLEAFQLYNNLMKESISKQTALLSSSSIAAPMSSITAPAATAGIMNNGINYSSAPPNLDAANSLAFANKLNSMAYPPPSYHTAPPTSNGSYASSVMNSNNNGMAFLPGQLYSNQMSYGPPPPPPQSMQSSQPSDFNAQPSQINNSAATAYNTYSS